MDKKNNVKEVMPIHQKYLLSVEEASIVFNIGQKTLRRFVNDHADEPFVIHIGANKRIKRKMFEQYLDRIQVM